MNDILIALRDRALADPAFRQGLLATRSASDPLLALCEFASSHGYPLDLGDIISDGEEFCCNQMKSTNGGNPMPYDCFGFDDAY
ncbi:MAG: Nif11-like leader peptide family natural product precursor, partial [Eubacteriales bacterium]|nr:Nif11-like leader peptide family natural product precursor [Eubacteriales bacterium]